MNDANVVIETDLGCPVCGGTTFVQIFRTTGMEFTTLFMCSQCSVACHDPVKFTVNGANNE